MNYFPDDVQVQIQTSEQLCATKAEDVIKSSAAEGSVLLSLSVCAWQM